MALTRARVALKILPFERVAGRFGDPGGLSTEAPQEGPPDPRVQRVGWAVSAAARHLPWTCSCLPQALAGRRMLARRGYAPTIYLGVRKASWDDLEAHAWVTCGGVVVTGRHPEGRYRILAAYATPADR